MATAALAIHVIPLADSRPHESSARCPCAPAVDDESGAVVHNAFDLREAYEASAGEPMPGAAGWAVFEDDGHED